MGYGRACLLLPIASASSSTKRGRGRLAPLFTCLSLHLSRRDSPPSRLPLPPPLLSPHLHATGLNPPPNIKRQALVEVFETGYRLRFRRTEGAALPDAQRDFEPGALLAYRQRLADRPIGVDLRQGWAQPVAIPYSGVVD